MSDPMYSETRGRKKRRIRSSKTAVTFLACQSLALFPSPFTKDGVAQSVVVDGGGASSAKVLSAPNGVPIVNIARPHEDGLSHNRFSKFDIGSEGLILNNSRDLSTSTHLGGQILGNTNLVGRSAKVILNEVTGTSRSALRGFAEVAGPSADVIVANPNGVTCSGCGFHNTPHATITAGTPIISGGKLSGFRVDAGDVDIGRAGANASQVDVFDIISRRISLDGPVVGKTVRMLAGPNETTYSASGDAIEHRLISEEEDKSEVAISSTAFGGIYGDRVSVVANKKGAGVTMLGDMASSTGSLTLTADGRLVARNVASAGKVELRSARSSVSAGRVAARGPARVAAAKTIEAEAVSAADEVILSAGDDVMLGEALAGGRLEVTAGGKIGKVSTSYGIADELIESGSGKTVIGADGTVSLHASSLSVDTVLSASGVEIDVVRDIELGLVSAGNNVNISSHAGDLRASEVLSGGALVLTAESGAIVGQTKGTDIAAVGSATIAAKSSVSLGQVVVDGSLSATSGSALTIDKAQAKAIVLDAQTLDAGNMSADVNVAARTQGNLTIANLWAGDGVELASAANISADNVVTKGDVAIKATKALSSRGNIVGAGVSLEAGADLTTELVAGGREIEIAAAVVKAGSLYSGVDLDGLLASGGIKFSTTAPDGGISVAAREGSLELGEVIGSADAHFLAHGDVSYRQATVSGGISITTDGGAIALTSTVVGGNLDIKSSGDVNLGDGRLADRADASNSIGGYLVVEAQTLRLDNSQYAFGGYDISLSGDFTLNNASIRANGNAQSGAPGDFVINAGDIVLGKDSSIAADRYALLTARGMLVNQGQLSAGENVEILAAGAIENRGAVRSGGSIVLADADAEGVLRRTKSVVLADTSVIASEAGDVAILSARLDSAGALSSRLGELTIEAADIAETGSISARAVALRADDKLSLGGDLSSDGTLSVLADEIENRGRISAAGSIFLGNVSEKDGSIVRAARIVNEGDIASNETLAARGDEFLNDGLLSAEEGLIVDARSVGRSGDLNAGKGTLQLLSDDNVVVSGLLHGASGVELFAARATVQSGAGLQSAAGDVLVKAGRLDSSGSLSAGGNLLIDADAFSASGALSGGNIALNSGAGLNLGAVDFHTTGLLQVTTKGDIILSGDAGAPKTLTAGDIQLAASGGSILLTGATLDARGNASLSLAGVVLLDADNDIRLSAASRSTTLGEVIEAAGGPAVTRVDGVSFLGFIPVGDVYKYHNWERRWTETVHVVSASELVATGDVVLSAGGAITLSGSDIRTGGGQLLTSSTVSLQPVKTGVEKTGLRLTDHGVIQECVVILGCRTVGSHGIDVVETFADEVSYKVSTLSGGVASLANRIDVVSLAQNVAGSQTQLQGPELGSAVGSHKKSAEVGSGQAFVSLPGSNLALKQEQLANERVDASSVGAGSATIDDRAHGVALPETPGLAEIPKEGTEGLATVDELQRDRYFLDQSGYARHAATLDDARKNELQRRQQELSPSAETDDVAGEGNSDGIVRTVAEMKAGLSSDIIINTSGDIYGLGAQITTAGLVSMRSVSGNIRFDGIEVNSSNVSGGSQASTRGAFGSTEGQQSITKLKSFDYAQVTGGRGVSLAADAGRIDLSGTDVVSQSGSINLAAKQIQITSLTSVMEVTEASQHAGFLYTADHYKHTAAEMTQAAALKAGGDIVVRADDGISIHAAALKAEGNIALVAGYAADGTLVNSSAGISMTAARDRIETDIHESEHGLFVGSKLGGETKFADQWLSLYGGSSSATKAVNVLPSVVAATSGKNTTLVASGDIKGEAPTISAGGSIGFEGKTISLSAVAAESFSRTEASSSTLGIGKPSVSSTLTALAGVASENSSVKIESVTHQGAAVTADGDVTFKAADSIRLENVDVAAGRDIGLEAGGNIDIVEAVNSSRVEMSSNTAFAGLEFRLTSPLLSGTDSARSATEGLVKATGAAADALQEVTDPFAKIRLASASAEAGKKMFDLAEAAKSLHGYVEGASKVLSGESKPKDFTLFTIGAGANVRLDHAGSEKTETSVDGSTLIADRDLAIKSGADVLIRAGALTAKSSLVIDAAGNIVLDAAYDTTEESSNKSSLYAYLGLEAGVNAGLDASLTGARFEIKGSKDNASSLASQAAVSRLLGSNVELRAGKDIRGIGSLIEGLDVSLVAGDNISLSSAISTKTSEKDHVDGGFSLAAKLGPEFVPTSLSISASGKVSAENAYSRQHILAVVKGTRSVTIKSGGDVALDGSRIEGAKVAAEIGGDLFVRSVQDVTKLESNSVGGNVSLGLKTSGPPSFGFGFSIAHSEIDKAWVNRMSGIVGTDTVDVSVGGTTNLVGGVIASETGKLNLDTGSIVYSNVADHDRMFVGQFGLGLSFKSLDPGNGFANFALDNISPPSLNFGFDAKDKERSTSATVGAGVIRVGGNEVSPPGLNRGLLDAQPSLRDVDIDALAN
ncbi:two-partner secretion domain-containing protein [Ensifer sp. SL37]|uniref:two-partner secretion domain-containing protein n=1 Tax=Ensifer sp. SL37 TaxID=2995137 RepID=UPI00227564D5|nr:hemagglutinin repeat-containing protein [Ensifer sp. SL37]MCY1740783.1 hemagglutinin repeat-containing protein [Ensifer sp. SL37]